MRIGLSPDKLVVERRQQTIGFFLAEIAGFWLAVYAIFYFLFRTTIKSVFYLNLVSSLFDISQSVIDPKTGQKIPGRAHSRPNPSYFRILTCRAMSFVQRANVGN